MCRGKDLYPEGCWFLSQQRCSHYSLLFGYLYMYLILCMHMCVSVCEHVFSYVGAVGGRSVRFRFYQQHSDTQWALENFYIGPACEGHCGGHGDCLDQRCLCDPGFSGPGCHASSPLRVQPLFTRVPVGLEPLLGSTGLVAGASMHTRLTHARSAFKIPGQVSTCSVI